MMNEDKIDQRIQTLRRFIQTKPQNGRAIAQLAYLLHEKGSKGDNNNKNDGNRPDNMNHNYNNNNNNDAMMWAQRSIDVASQKPYGYIAMSMILPTHCTTERIEYIQNAIERCTTSTIHFNCHVIKFHLFIRLLIEPREEEKRVNRLIKQQKQQQQQQQKSSSSLLPSRQLSSSSKTIDPTIRPLSTKEEEIYQQIVVLHQSDLMQHLRLSHTIKGNESLETKIDDDETQPLPDDTTTPRKSSMKNNNTNHLSRWMNDMGMVGYDIYRLGLLFRKMKMDPLKQEQDRIYYANTKDSNIMNKYQIRSMDWFQKAISHFDIILQSQQHQQRNQHHQHAKNHDQNIGKIVLDDKTNKFSTNSVATEEEPILIQGKTVAYYSSMAQFWFETLSSENSCSNDHSFISAQDRERTETLRPTTTSTSKMKKCPPEYIIGLYSTFAERFDTLLVQELQYQTPTLLCQLVNECYTTRIINIHGGWKWNNTTKEQPQLTAVAADLGCGTGLSGTAFADHCLFLQEMWKQCHPHNNHTDTNKDSHIQRMIGVDLSSHMIEKAKQRHCYDTLYVGDVTTILAASTSCTIVPIEQSERIPSTTKDNNNNETSTFLDHAIVQHDDTILSSSLPCPNFQYGIIFACDVFVYIGDLQEIIQRTYHSLVVGGLFAFSTELLMIESIIQHGKHRDQNNNNPNRQSSTTVAKVPSYVLHSCARFAHSEEYIRTLSLDTGFIILDCKICTIRKNQGKDVMGLLIVLQKPTLNNHRP
jgi:predicted TPR repeat methyltransferase